MMISDCCVPIPYAFPSAGQKPESVSARDGDPLRAAPIPKQLSYLLRTAEHEDYLSKSGDSRVRRIKDREASFFRVDYDRDRLQLR